MCINCWHDYGSPTIWNEDVQEAVGLVKKVLQYDSDPDNLYMLSEFDLEDDAFEDFEMPLMNFDVPAEQLSAERECYNQMRYLSVEERASVMGYMWGFWSPPEGDGFTAPSASECYGVPVMAPVVEALKSGLLSPLFVTVATVAPIPSEFDEAAAKFEASILLQQEKGIVIPTYEQWIGLNMLERDDELKRKHKP